MVLAIITILALLGRLEAITLETESQLSCPAGHYRMGPWCYGCQDLCAACSSQNSCSACVSNANSSNGGECTCDNGFHADSSGTECDADESFLQIQSTVID